MKIENEPSRQNKFLIILAIGAFGFVESVSSAQTPGKPLLLPARYDENRFYVQPVTTDGVMLTFYTDTGGGLFIYRKTAERLHLQIINTGGQGDDALYVASLPPFKPGASIPPPLTRDGRILVFSPSANERESLGDTTDGMLGQEWFGGRVWTFDYPRKQLQLRAPADVPKVAAAHRISLTFKTDAGQRVLNFPRIQVVIDGETLDLLFDTGATTTLSDAALVALRDHRPAERATSFITASTFAKWHSRHPDWRVIEGA